MQTECIQVLRQVVWEVSRVDMRQKDMPFFQFTSLRQVSWGSTGVGSGDPAHTSLIPRSEGTVSLYVYIMHANVLCMNPHITTPLMGETWCNSRDVSTRQECQRPFWTAHDGHGRRCDTVLTSDASKHHCRNCGRVVCDECSKDGEGWKVGWRRLSCLNSAECFVTSANIVAGHMMTPCWSTPLFTYTPTGFCTWMWLLWTKTDTQNIASGFEKEWFSIDFLVSMYTTIKD